MKSKFLSVIIAVSLASLCSNAFAWTLNNEASSVSFITIKKANIGETHTFSDVSGSIVDGKAAIEIKADSVDTLVEIRDDRIREFLFETKTHPTINVNADVSGLLSDLEVGQSKMATLGANLSLHGVNNDILLKVRLSKLSESAMVVATSQAVIIRAKDYALLEGVMKLSELVNGLPIAQTVPVSFSLMFNK